MVLQNSFGHGCTPWGRSDMRDRLLFPRHNCDRYIASTFLKSSSVRTCFDFAMASDTTARLFRARRSQK